MTTRRNTGTVGLGGFLLLILLGGCGGGGEAADPATSAPTTSPDPTAPAATPAARGGSGSGTTAPPPTTAPTTTVAPTTTAPPVGGWAIHDLVAAKNNPELQMNYDAVSCESELGPWEIVVTFDVPGNITHDVGYTVTLGPDGTGTVTGYELSTWDDGVTVEGASTGTATLVPDGANHRLQFSYTESVVFSDGTNQTNEHDRDLAVIPATADECP